jgi:hypothetical protein
MLLFVCPLFCLEMTETECTSPFSSLPLTEQNKSTLSLPPNPPNKLKWVVPSLSTQQYEFGFDIQTISLKTETSDFISTLRLLGVEESVVKSAEDVAEKCEVMADDEKCPHVLRAYTMNIFLKFLCQVCFVFIFCFVLVFIFYFCFYFLF